MTFTLDEQLDWLDELVAAAHWYTESERFFLCSNSAERACVFDCSRCTKGCVWGLLNVWRNLKGWYL